MPPGPRHTYAPLIGPASAPVQRVDGRARGIIYREAVIRSPASVAIGVFSLMPSVRYIGSDELYPDLWAGAAQRVVSRKARRDRDSAGERAAVVHDVAIADADCR